MAAAKSLLSTAAITVAILVLGLSGSLATAQQKSSSPSADIGKFSGPGGCAASNCHGSVSPKTVTRIAQNEYSIWAARTKHARAFGVLSNPVSLRMGKILNLSSAPNQAQKCLACHSLSPPANLR